VQVVDGGSNDEDEDDNWEDGDGVIDLGAIQADQENRRASVTPGRVGGGGQGKATPARATPGRGGSTGRSGSTGSTIVPTSAKRRSNIPAARSAKKAKKAKLITGQARGRKKSSNKRKRQPAGKADDSDDSDEDGSSNESSEVSQLLDFRVTEDGDKQVRRA
jgi:hypothetical protein